MGNGIGIIEPLVRFYRCVSTCAAGDRGFFNIFHIFNIFQHFQHFQHFSTFLDHPQDGRPSSSEMKTELLNVKHGFSFSNQDKKDHPIFIQYTPTTKKPLGFKNHCIFNIFNIFILTNVEKCWKMLKMLKNVENQHANQELTTSKHTFSPHQILSDVPS